MCSLRADHDADVGLASRRQYRDQIAGHRFPVKARSAGATPDRIAQACGFTQIRPSSSVLEPMTPPSSSNASRYHRPSQQFVLMDAAPALLPDKSDVAYHN
jgi:hypothetical protein